MSAKSSSAAPPKMKWTSEMETILIQLVEKRPHLWDSSNENYLKKNLKQHSFKEIGEALKEKWPECSPLFTHESLVNKFANLRSYYRREWKKLKQIRNAKESENFVPKWDHFARLSFLEDALLRENVESNLYSVALEPCEVSMTSEASLPDSEPDDSDLVQTSSSKRRTNCVASDGEESNPRKKTKSSPSNTDESSSDASNSTTDRIPPYTGPSFPNATEPNSRKKNADKDSVDSAFCHYVYKMLLAVPESYEKEVTKLKIIESVMKLKYQKA